MSYYQHHVFFCTNERENDLCCANHGSKKLRNYAKDRIKKLRLHGAGKIRINSSGCMGRCEQGPIIAIYPEGVWYTYHSESDIDEIIDQHILNGCIVDRLQLTDV